MREALFIKKNKERWLKIQQGYSASADEMASEFTKLIDDLAYAKTFYPSSRMTAYVNSLASRIYLHIYQNSRERTNRLLTFWKYGLPLTIRKHRQVILFSLFLFLVFFSVAFYTSAKDESIIRDVLGDGYVNMTHENIKQGNPFGVYEGDHPIQMWLRIMIHNIRISVWSFVSGMLVGIPTLVILINNSFMVGAFYQLFYAEGLGFDFFMVVFVHGMLELTALVIASAAGLVLWKTILFPGTFSRLTSFKDGARDGVKLIIGLFPVFGLAAFFEGFITRLYNDAPWLTYLVVFTSAAFVVWYFIIYPGRIEKKLADKLLSKKFN